jgi:ABC-2 type transport system ATP-binding protein
MTAILETSGLSKRYGRRFRFPNAASRAPWALRDCTLTIPEGKVVGLVGPNGAGKTTLLQLAAGLLMPTSGTIRVLGGRPADGPAQLGRVGFVAQDAPVYPGLSVTGHLRMGGYLNPGWDRETAERRVRQVGLDPGQRAGKLSGGQRAQLALTLAIAKRPELLLLDEPVAGLDPRARREFLQGLMEEVAAREVSVVLSSHLVADLERVCDYLIVLVGSRVALAGEIGQLLASHHRISGPRRDAGTLPASMQVIEQSHTGRQSTFLVRCDSPVLDPAWTIKPVSLDDMAIAYMGPERDAAAAPPGWPAPPSRSPAPPASPPSTEPPAPPASQRRWRWASPGRICSASTTPPSRIAGPAAAARRLPRPSWAATTRCRSRSAS